MWLLQEEFARELQRIETLGIGPTASQREEFDRLCAEAPDVAAARISSASGDTMEIRVEGVLTERPHVLAALFGAPNTSYRVIREALAKADADPSVSRVSLIVNSPGGSVDGLFPTLDAIRAFRKPMSVRAERAESAAYAIAAASGASITAASEAASFGSIGVAATFFKSDSVVNITNSDSPKKRPDLSTEDGRKSVQEYLDQMHDLFVGAIAEGRTAAGTKVSPEDVSKKFGRGASMLAKAAQQAGLIDSYPAPVKRNPRALGADNSTEPSAAHVKKQDAPANPGGASTKDTGMTLEELKKEHPELHAVLSEGLKEGQKKERDRVVAHLTMGEASGDMKTAVEAITAGEEMTQTYQAKYMAAGMNKRDRETRQNETETAAAAVSNAAPVAATEQDLGDQVVAILKSGGGV